MIEFHLVKEAAEAWLYERVCTLVLWFFLYPHHFGSRVFFDFGFHTTEWEGCDLFDSHYGDILNLALVSLIFKIIVNLSSAENDLSYLIIGHKIWQGVWQDHFESQSFIKSFDI